MLKQTVWLPLMALAAAQTITVTRATTRISGGSAVTVTQTITTGSSAPSISAVSECHLHGATQFCMAGTTELQVQRTGTATTNLPASYTGCHNHGSDLYCFSPNRGEVELRVEGGSSAEPTAAAESCPEDQKSCHFHAGVEHCVCAGQSEHASEVSCEKVDRDYNMGLRIGLLFVMLSTSFLGVFVPIILASKFAINTSSVVFVLLRQFGTGIITSTAFVHLYTHASLMFNNPCLGALSYEATTSAILMAGIFVTFAVEYLGHRFAHRHDYKEAAIATGASPIAKKHEASSDENLPISQVDTENACTRSRVNIISVTVLEAGIVFHSLLIGITLVVAGDTFFNTLFAVITFHQLFEGIALGTLIAALKHTSMLQRTLMALTFAVITPIGMGIGIGVLRSFNGNDKGTTVAIGTLNAFSAGILVWVGVVEMWARDWVHGVLKDARPVFAFSALVVLAFGMGIMSFLGKWA